MDIEKLSKKVDEFQEVLSHCGNSDIKNNILDWEKYKQERKEEFEKDLELEASTYAYRAIENIKSITRFLSNIFLMFLGILIICLICYFVFYFPVKKIWTSNDMDLITKCILQMLLTVIIHLQIIIFFIQTEILNDFINFCSGILYDIIKFIIKLCIKKKIKERHIL